MDGSNRRGVQPPWSQPERENPEREKPERADPEREDPEREKPEREKPERADLDGALAQVARGDQHAFEAVFDALAGPVYGLICQVLRDPAQSEEVSQEVMLEVWRTASRFNPARGSAVAWVMTIAHRRAVDRVRAAAAAAAREHRAAERLAPDDEVGDLVEARAARERVRHCLGELTEQQREAITLAYYGGYSYRQVATMLGVALSTIKTRIRTGLIRMRDCLGVKW